MMNLFGDILKSKNLNSPILRGVRASQVVEAAEKILITCFGETIKEQAAPAYFKNNTLTIACLSSTAAQEIKLYEQQILKELNGAVYGADVRKIRYLS